MEDLLFYDIECFKFDTLVVFKDINNKEVAHFWNNRERKFEEDPSGFEGIPELIKDKTLVGYNNYYYDDIMLTMILRELLQRTLKATNDTLISGNNHGIKCDERINSLDCFQQIDVSMPGLKRVEGNMGKSIIESSVPFDIDRPLTDKERAEALSYCRYDVEQTIGVYKLREYNYFHVKKMLIEMLDNPKAIRWNTTTISANILLKQKEKRWTKLKIPNDKWRNVKGIPEPVWEMWDKCNDPENNTVTGLSYELEAFGNVINFAFGGLHGAPKEPGIYRNVKLLDVGSMYPSIIILLNALGDSTGKYDDIRKQRLAIKHKDKLMSNALKLVLNSVYGNLKNQYSLLFNELASRTVCIFGQMALFDLCRELDEAGYKVMNINTDGVAFTLNGKGKEYETIWHDWEIKWGLNLELDEFDVWYQKDVSNYVATHGKDIKVKGSQVNKYHCNPEKGVHQYFKNNDTRITHICLVEWLIHEKSPIDTILENLDKPILFQYVLKAGRTFKGVYDTEGNPYQNVNRIFAVTEKAPHTKLVKIRTDGGQVNFPDSPARMWVWNDDIEKIDLNEFSEILDIKHYLDLANKKISMWCNPQRLEDWKG